MCVCMCVCVSECACVCIPIKIFVQTIQDEGQQFLSILLLEPIEPRSTSPHRELGEMNQSLIESELHTNCGHLNNRTMEYTYTVHISMQHTCTCIHVYIHGNNNMCNDVGVIETAKGVLCFYSFHSNDTSSI